MLVSVVVILVLAGCSGSTIKSDGTVTELRWPDLSSAAFDKNRGTFPNIENLLNIRSAMTKDQLYKLIGYPQFYEGFHVREWNYLFHFNTPSQGTDGITTCQYKVVFDNKAYARSFFWRAVDPVDAVCPPNKDPGAIIREIKQTEALIRQ